MTGEALLLRILAALLDVFGPALIRQKVDEWEVARAESDAAFAAKFKEPP